MNARFAVIVMIGASFGCARFTPGEIDGDAGVTAGQGGGAGRPGNLPSSDAFAIAFPDGSAPGPDPMTEYKRPPPDWNCGASCFRDPAFPGAGDPAARFTGAAMTSTRLPVLYPLPRSLHPINLPELTVHWRRPDANATAFRLRFTGGGKNYDFFAPCKPPQEGADPTECVYLLPEGSWLDLTWENRDKEITLTVAMAGSGASVETSAAVPLTMSAAPVEGGLYYWSTALQGTYRLLFGTKKATPFISPNSDTNSFMCGGCHAVSRNGNVIAFAAEQAGYLTVAPTDDPTKPTIRPAMPPVTDGHLMTLSPDGALVLVSYGTNNNMDNGKILVRDTQTGKEVSRLDPAVLGLGEKKVYFPEWSPDGKEIVATVASQDERPWSVNNGYIVIFPYNDGKFGPARAIVPKETAMFHYYPTWSPDGKWVAFTSAPIKVKSYDNPQSRLRLVSRDGGKVYDLGQATQEIGRTSTWPKFAPFQQAGGKLMFITFNTKIDYGLMLKNGADPDGGRPQLWMSAVDLRKLESGDPSWAPVWLPFQDVSQRNHLGYWTERVVCRANDGTSGCGEGAICDQGKCYLSPG